MLTKKGGYAVGAVLDIARHHPQLRTTRQITETMDLPRDFISQILASLVRYGVLRSAAGPAGGYTLQRPPAEVTVLDVIEIIEGPITLEECVLGGGACDWSRLCSLHDIWSNAQREFQRQLATTSFESLSAVDTGISAGM